MDQDGDSVYRGVREIECKTHSIDKKTTYSPISGIVVPLITPMTRDLSLDSKALFRLMDHVIEGGVNGIFLLGSTGEGLSLDAEIKKQLVFAGAEAISNRVPLYVNITSNSHNNSIGWALLAEKVKADYVVLAPPYYYPMNQMELLRYFKLIADHSPLPLILYNAPQYTKNELSPDTVSQLAMHDNILGMKDSSGNMNYITAVLTLTLGKHFPLLIGPELLLVDSLAMGCAGVVNGGANLFPRLYASIVRTVMQKESNELNRIKAILDKIERELYQVADSPMGIVIGLKYLLSQKGICNDLMALPVYDELTELQKTKMISLLEEIESMNY